MKLLPVTDDVVDYCKDVAAKANAMGLRVEVDRGNERLAKQIRNAEQSRIQFEDGMLPVCSQKMGDLGSYRVDELLEELTRCNLEAHEMTEMGCALQYKT